MSLYSNRTVIKGQCIIREKLKLMQGAKSSSAHYWKWIQWSSQELMCHDAHTQQRVKVEKRKGNRRKDYRHSLPHAPVWRAVQISTSLCVSLLAVKAKRKAGKWRLPPHHNASAATKGQDFWGTFGWQLGRTHPWMPTSFLLGFLCLPFMKAKELISSPHNQCKVCVSSRIRTMDTDLNRGNWALTQERWEAREYPRWTHRKGLWDSGAWSSEGFIRNSESDQAACPSGICFHREWMESQTTNMRLRTVLPIQTQDNKVKHPWGPSTNNVVWI